jgi:hypothetical protein
MAFFRACKEISMNFITKNHATSNKGVRSEKQKQKHKRKNVDVFFLSHPSITKLNCLASDIRRNGVCPGWDGHRLKFLFSV